MNQILNSNDELNTNSSNISPKKRKLFLFFKFQFIFSSILVLVITGYYFYIQYDKRRKESLSQEIINRFSITNLYDNNNKNHLTSRLSTENTYQTDTSTFSVIGLIEIKSIGVYYPIINEFSYELLKIAPCKFLGPNPNEIRQLMYCWS